MPISEGGQKRAFQNGPHLLDLGEGFTEPASLQTSVGLFIVGTLRPQKKKKKIKEKKVRGPSVGQEGVEDTGAARGSLTAAGETDSSRESSGAAEERKSCAVTAG